MTHCIRKELILQSGFLPKARFTASSPRVSASEGLPAHNSEVFSDRDLPWVQHSQSCDLQHSKREAWKALGAVLTFWVMAASTVPAKLLLRHEFQENASFIAVLTLAQDKRERKERDFQGTWHCSLLNVGGLPWAVTKCSYWSAGFGGTITIAAWLW